jgi:hypothetical protein
MKASLFVFLVFLSVHVTAFAATTTIKPKPKIDITKSIPLPKKAPTKKPEVKKKVGLSNDNYYTNSKGNAVHSPAFADSVPVGASAQCRDGTYSFSQSRRGTCSRHGGVGEWL